MHHRLILLGFLFSLLYNGLMGQPMDHWEGRTDTILRFEAFDNEKGMPNSSVWAILQDSTGFMWFGTKIGLVRYDGYDFKLFQYQPGDTSQYGQISLPIHVNSLAEAPGGDLLVGCYEAIGDTPTLFHFDRKSEKLVPFSLGPMKPVQKNIGWNIQIGGEYIWLDTRPILRIPLPEKHDERDGLKAEVLRSGRLGLRHEDFGDMNLDAQGRIWLPTYGGVYRWRPERDSFEYYKLPILELDRDSIIYGFEEIVELDDGWMWINANGYHVRFHPETGQIHTSFYPRDAWGHSLYSRRGGCWRGLRPGSGGLLLLDPDSHRLLRVGVRVEDRPILPVLRVRSMFEDRSGNIWIGTEQGPLLKYNPRRDHFHWIFNDPGTDDALSHNLISGIGQDPEGNYWLTTFGGGLNRWDRAEDRFFHYRAGDKESALTSDNLQGLAISPQGKAWFGEGAWLRTLDPEIPDFEPPEGGGTITSLVFDKEDRLWLTRHCCGLYLVQSEKREFTEYRPPDPKYPSEEYSPALSGAFVDSRGHFWLGTVPMYRPVPGFYRFKPESKEFDGYELPEAHSFAEDGFGRVWIASLDGLFRFDPITEQFTRYGVEDGLAGNQVGSVQVDEGGRIWAGTSGGLSRYNPVEGTFRNYVLTDGLPGYEFTRATYMNAEGELFFGTNRGLLFFYPDSLIENEVSPQLAIRQIDIFGQPLTIDPAGPLRQPASLTRYLELPYWKNHLTIHYTALHFTNPERNRYRVLLRGQESEWREMGTQPFATYTNLDPGSYTFEVQGANSDGIWNEKPLALDIRIHPPWWATKGSYVLYGLLAGGLLYILFRGELQRQLAREEARRMEELDHVKSRLYTNITHEFRTPLTIIQGMAGLIGQRASGALRDQSRLIQSNGAKLFRLVNELLDLARLESGSFHWEPVHADILPFLGYLTQAFASMAEARGIDLRFQPEVTEVNMDFDPRRVEQILGNLISNALKFTPSGRKVWVGVDTRDEGGNAPASLEIEVGDTGNGIAQEDLEHLFDRFFQVQSGDTRKGEGTGIGLALVKELVLGMEGKIEVESEKEKGSLFRISLPIRNQAKPVTEADILAHSGTPEAYVSMPVHENAPASGMEGSEQLLIVEDNPDLVQYLRTCLGTGYKILVAGDGQQGWHLALEHLPDIVISDVMMPEMDGFELCRKLKEDERTSHIPVILLTARATGEDRITGLHQGADAYLAKPFDPGELEARLGQLVRLRRRLQKKYARLLAENKGSTRGIDLENPADQKFLQKAISIIDREMPDPGFGVAELSKEIGLSRVQVHRKLRALTGESPSAIIRRLRLRRARQLLRESDSNVGDIAAEVGYNDPAYFSRVYKDTFGCVPSADRD